MGCGASKQAPSVSHSTSTDAALRPNTVDQRHRRTQRQSKYDKASDFDYSLPPEVEAKAKRIPAVRRVHSRQTSANPTPLMEPRPHSRGVSQVSAQSSMGGPPSQHEDGMNNLVNDPLRQVRQQAGAAGEGGGGGRAGRPRSSTCHKRGMASFEDLVLSSHFFNLKAYQKRIQEGGAHPGTSASSKGGADSQRPKTVGDSAAASHLTGTTVESVTGIPLDEGAGEGPGPARARARPTRFMRRGSSFNHSLLTNPTLHTRDSPLQNLSRCSNVSGSNAGEAFFPSEPPPLPRGRPEVGAAGTGSSSEVEVYAPREDNIRSLPPRLPKNALIFEWVRLQGDLSKSRFFVPPLQLPPHPLDPTANPKKASLPS